MVADNAGRCCARMALAFLVVTDVVGVNVSLIGAAALAVANAGVGVLVHQGVLFAYRHLRRSTSSEVPN